MIELTEVLEDFDHRSSLLPVLDLFCHTGYILLERNVITLAIVFKVKLYELP